MIPNSLLMPPTGAISPSIIHDTHEWKLPRFIRYLVMHTLGHKQFLPSIYTHNLISMLYSNYTYNQNTAMTKEREINPRSLENLKLGAIARNKNKIRRNTTLLPETITWLEACGNVSDTIDALVADMRDGKLTSIDEQPKLHSNNTHNKIAKEVEALRVKTEQLESQLAPVEAERDHLRLQLEHFNQSAGSVASLESDRDRFLASLRLGKQSLEYKRIKKAVDQFIAFVQSS